MRLDNCYIAKMNEDGTYGDPIKVGGPIELISSESNDPYPDEELMTDWSATVIFDMPKVKRCTKKLISKIHEYERRKNNDTRREN